MTIHPKQINIPVIVSYIVRSVGYLRLTDGFSKRFGNIKKYKGEPEVTLTKSNTNLTLSYTFRIDPETQKIIQEE